MRNRLQHTHILTALLVLVIIVSSAILGGAWYLIDYALKPGDRSRNEQLAWAEWTAFIQAWPHGVTPCKRSMRCVTLL